LTSSAGAIEWTQTLQAAPPRLGRRRVPPADFGQSGKEMRARESSTIDQPVLFDDFQYLSRAHHVREVSTHVELIRELT